MGDVLSGNAWLLNRMCNTLFCYLQMIETVDKLGLCLTQWVKSNVRSGGTLPKIFAISVQWCKDHAVKM